MADKKTPVLETKHLGIDFGGLTAVDEFNIEVEHGEIKGLIGPNGAGKTTIFNLLTKVYKPSRGVIILDGTALHQVFESTALLLGRISIVREHLYCIHRVIPAVIEEIADVMSLKNLNNALEIFLLVRLELIAARSDRPGDRCIAQQGNLFFRLCRKVEKLLFQDPFDPMAGAVNFADRAIRAGGVNHAAQT